jgi:PspA associated protein B
VGFLDALLGRTKPVQPNLDRLFALPSAAITLAASTSFTPTGVGSVCFRPMEGRAFSDIEAEVRELLDADAEKTMPVEVTADSYGFTWMVIRQPADQFEGLVTDLHAVNSTLADNGFGPSLLCSLVAFRDAKQRSLAIVYLYKRGTFYPFAPLPGEKRGSAVELQVRAAIEGDLPIETDLGRWFPVWGAPGL